MASKRRLRRKSCLNKKAYTQQGAVYRSIELRKQSIDVYEYKCRFADHWHVGHRPAELERELEPHTSLRSVGRFKRLYA